MAKRFSTKHKALIAIAVVVVLFLVLVRPVRMRSSTSTVLLDRDGLLLAATVAADGMWRFPAADTVPHRFATCLLQFEDAHFYRHMGVNPVSVVRAAVQNARARRVVSGASTITMQLVRLSRGRKPRTYTEKLVELVLAVRTELTRSKRSILAMYAANAPFGGNVVGLEAAAWRYFGIPSHQLSWAEAAALAVLPNAPGLVFPGRNQQTLHNKRNALLKKLLTKNIITDEDYQLALLEPLPNPANALPQEAPHLLTRCIASGLSGRQLRSTLNRNLQAEVQQVAQNHHKHLMANDIRNIAIMVLDNTTGQVLAYVGNIISDRAELSPRVDIIGSRRSYGSLLKPFLYGLMIAEGELLPTQLVDDCPVAFVGFAPKNFNHQFDGAVPAHQAVARSLNVPAVQMLHAYGVEKFYHNIKSMGLRSINRPPDHYGLSIILGGAEATMLELSGLYCALARRAMALPHHQLRPQLLSDSLALPTPECSCHGLGPGAAFLCLEAISQTSRPDEQGTLRHFATAQRVAWKTGTSMGFRDAWAIGCSPQHTVAVWAGNADGEGRPNLVGSLAAAPAMFDVFARLPRSGWFEQPTFDLQAVKVCPESGLLASANCPSSTTQLVPRTTVKSLPCHYHQRALIHRKTKQRVTYACARPDEVEEQHFFVLPPVQEWYYMRQHPGYRPLPPFSPDCQPTDQRNASMALIYPHSDADIYIPTEGHGQRGQTLLRAAHSNPNATIFWHLNSTFIGSTTAPHELLAQPEPGSYTLTLVDDQGQTLRRNVSFVGTKQH